ncbi:hypothetical protein [Lentzea albida]|uniref:Restriction endonuclease n=1 Tax=Lentzea albida TaxID=65499 RepID=A0A1H9X1N5_9PSEU|nr:hypothetical protein [Lentzea albida]SES40004.1 hypothetical protein SAMN04488000_12698 [Lentzea albida]
MSLNIGAQQQVPETVRAAIVCVCRDALHWRGDLEALYLGCGVPASMYERYNHADFSKAKIARAVLNELHALGPTGAVIQRKIVDELCRMGRPHTDAPDQAKGRAALAALKEEATTQHILVDPEQAAAEQRRSRADQQQRAQQQRLERLSGLERKFFDLLRAQPRTQQDRQQRGYALETLLVDLFSLYDIEYRRPYRLQHEQIDGSFHFRGFTYLVEAKWEKHPPTFGDLAKFKFNVDGKLDSTRGLFVAMAGFDNNTLDHLANVARGSRNNLILVDAQDLITIFDGRMTLSDALIAKIDAAEQEGRCWLPLGR